MSPLRPLALTLCIVLHGDALSVPSEDSEPTVTAAPVVKIPAASSHRLVLNLSGSPTSTESKDWASFKSEWRAIFEQQASAAGITFEWQDGAARHLGQAGTLVVVHVNDYRFVGQGSRIFFGSMTGNAYINANLRYINLKSGAPMGAHAVNTSSSAGHGVFASVTPKQIYAIADDVIRQMQTR